MVGTTKKGSADIWWIIIGAVLALVVLIVLLVAFTGRSTTLSQGLSDSEGKGGICVSLDSLCPPKSLKTTAFSCTAQRVCCLGAIKKCTSDADCGVDDNSNIKTCNTNGGYCQE